MTTMAGAAQQPVKSSYPMTTRPLARARPDGAEKLGAAGRRVMHALLPRYFARAPGRPSGWELSAAQRRRQTPNGVAIRASFRRIEFVGATCGWESARNGAHGCSSQTSF